MSGNYEKVLEKLMRKITSDEGERRRTKKERKTKMVLIEIGYAFLVLFLYFRRHSLDFLQTCSVIFVAKTRALKDLSKAKKLSQLARF